MKQIRVDSIYYYIQVEVKKISSQTHLFKLLVPRKDGRHHRHQKSLIIYYNLCIRLKFRKINPQFIT